jgi:hypothetical protein
MKHYRNELEAAQKRNEMLEGALRDLVNRAERARGILSNDGKDASANWGMLDTVLARSILNKTAAKEQS